MHKDNIIYNTNPEIIIGYQLGENEPIRLELVQGNRYEISYGIHQGIYIYEGKVADNNVNRKNHNAWIGANMFRNETTGELSFGFYGQYEPSLFTRICSPCKK
ncbi:MAG: hypothetical protein IKO36_03575 [Bacteroidaceae bacterium]|nr:hypothetical protein [Bacteroidaceae bacterium]